MLWSFLLIFVAVESNASPAATHTAHQSTELAAGRQAAPLNAALVGLFSPPFVVLVGMSALFYTFEKFTKDMVKAASDKTKLRFRRKKKKPVEGGGVQPFPTPAAPAPPARDFVREHRRFLSVLEKMKY